MPTKNGQYKITVEHRITRLETDVSEIKDNHLPHLQKGIDKNNDKIDKLLWLAVTTLIGVVITVFVK